MKALAFALVAFAAVPGLAGQQRRAPVTEPTEPGRPAVSLLAGPSWYDLSGTGSAFAAALRVDVPSGRILIIEPGVGFLRYENSTSGTVSYILPELSLQVQAPSKAVRPYIGGGLGFSEFLSGRGSTYATLHATAGLRFDASHDWGGRAEIRARSIKPFTGESIDLLVGITRRLRSR